MSDFKNREYLMLHYVTNNKSMAVIAKENNTKRKTIEYWTTKFGIKKYQHGFKYTIDESKVKLTPEMAYIIGLIITDGHLNKKVNAIHISLIDEDILLAICTYLGVTANIVRKKNTYVTNQVYEMYLGSKVLFDFLHFYIPRGNKTFKVDIPLFKTRELNLMLLRGLIDGDGTIQYASPNNGRLRIGLASEKAKDSYISLMRELYPTKHIRIYKRLTQTRNNFWSCECKFTIEEGIELYQEYSSMSISRKRNVVKKLVDDIVRTYKIINYKKW